MISKVFFSIIIVNYNLLSEILACINSAVSNLQLGDFELIIVDNASTETGFDYLMEKYSEYGYIRFIKLSENRGFGAGNNAGARVAKGDFLFFLNPDALIKENILPRIYEMFVTSKDIGAVGPRIVDQKNRLQVSIGSFPTILKELLEVFMLRLPFERWWFDRKQKQTLTKVDWVTGAALVIPKKVYNEVGGFDEQFFLYNEEVDLCLRIRRKGYHVIYNNELTVTHIGSVGSRKNYYSFTINSYKSKLLYIKKNHAGLEKVIMLFLTKVQMIIQIILWTILIPMHYKKSIGKVRAFFDMLTNRR